MVAAVIAFYPPEVVRVGWEAALETVPDIRATGLRYAQACHEWGRARLAGVTGVGRLADLALTVARQADIDRPAPVRRVAVAPAAGGRRRSARARARSSCASTAAACTSPLSWPAG